MLAGHAQAKPNVAFPTDIMSRGLKSRFVESLSRAPTIVDAFYGSFQDFVKFGAISCSPIDYFRFSGLWFKLAKISY